MLHVSMIEVGVGPRQPEKCTPPKWTYQKLRNLDHKYGAIRAKLPKKVDGAQSSINIRPIPPKDISFRA
jgi:hypothetical protein